MAPNNPQNAGPSTNARRQRPIIWGVAVSNSFSKRNGPGNGQPVTEDEVKTMAAAYVERVQAFASNASIKANLKLKADLKKEALVIYISREDIEALLADENSKGLLGIFAVEPDKASGEPDHQTIILVPHDEFGKALPLENQGYQGEERWPTDDDTIDKILGLNNPTQTNPQVNVKEKIEKYLDDLKL